MPRKRKPPPPPLLVYIRAHRLRERREAWERGEAGAARAADHAERVEPGWGDAALDALVRFAVRANGEPFMVEDVREYAEERCDVPAPPKNCAWGAVVLRAKREGYVVRAGASMTRRGPAHAKLGALWRLAAAPEPEAAHG